MKMIKTAACALLCFSAPMAVMADTGGKNRYADEEITESYLLCEREGVTEVTVIVNNVEVVIDCRRVGTLPPR